jgi:hypothetical protein
MSPRPATGTTPVTSNNTSEEDTVTSKTKYTPNRIDYSLLFDWLASIPGKYVSHDDLRDYLSSVGLADEFPHYRKALNYLSRPITTASLRQRHRVKGLVLNTSRGKYVYDPKAEVTIYSDSATTRVLSRLVNPDRGVPRRLCGPRSGEPTLIVYNRPSDVPVTRVDWSKPEPVVVPKAPAFPLAEVLADNDGTLVLRHEDGTVIVATVTARTVTTVS